MAGLDTQFTFNDPLHVRQLQMLGDLAKKGAFQYAGRTNEGGAKFASGECAMLTESTGGQANARRDAKFDWAVTEIPYWDDVKGAPQNAIIGGASLWVMGGKTNNAYKGVAKFFHFLSRPEIQIEWHPETGYVPITFAAYEHTKKSGYYVKNPGAEVAIKMLDEQAAHGQLEGPALRQLRAGPPGDRGRDGGGVLGQEGREDGARRRGAPRQRDPAQVRSREQVAAQQARQRGEAGRLPVEVVAVRPRGAADRGHGDLLLLAGGQAVWYAFLVQDPFGQSITFVWFQNFDRALP